jgi:hypothetical protein
MGAEVRVNSWNGYTPAGQRVTVERGEGEWVVTCDSDEGVRHRLLDLALIEAVRSDVQAHWQGVEPGQWTRVIADMIISTWQEET